VGLTVLDTSVLVAFLDSRDALHAQAVAQLRASRARSDLVVPVVAYAETLVGAVRGGTQAVEVLERFIDGAARLEPLTRAIARRAAALRARHTIRLPDALILATGMELGADEILTGDASWRRLDPSVRVIGGASRPRRARP
jgi:uncharacterized protein